MPHAHYWKWGTRVRWKRGGSMAAWRPDAEGEITGPPIGSHREPPGGIWVLWDELREPMACFEEDVQLVGKENT